MVLLRGWVAGSIPESLSTPFQATLTLPLYQPSALGSAVGAPLRSGLVWSMLIPMTSVPLLFPATSTASPCTDWLAPSLVSVVLPAQPATPVCRPDPMSAQLNVTSTSVLFHSKPF